MSSSSIVLQWSESDKNVIYKNYGRTSVTIQQDIENVKEWLRKQPHLLEIPADGIIERFLFLTKFRMEKAKQSLDMYYTVRSLVPEFYNLDPNSDVTRKLMQNVCYLPLPKLTKELLRPVIINVKCPEAPFDAVTYLAHTFNAVEIRLREEYSMGEIQIYDLTNVKVHHLAKFTPMVIKKSGFILEKVYSNGPKGIHFLNAPIFAESFLKLLKSVLKPKLAGRIFVHKDMGSLHQLVPKHVLPKDYGGDEKSIEELEEAWRKKFLEYDHLFKHLRELKVDESLRPGKPLDNDLFGIDGNFRKLDLD